jgi:hypothetical protein
MPQGMTLMPDLTSTNIDDALRFLASEHPSLLQPRSISLGAATELSVWSKSRSIGRTLAAALNAMAQDHSYLEQCSTILNGSAVPRPSDLYGVRSNEFFAIRGSNDVISDDWNRFLERFSAGLRSVGFSSPVSHGIAGGFHEIAENVVQHSAENSISEINGFAAYELADGRFTFVVCDAGLGVLSSLHTNPAWEHLPTNRAALQAIVREHASRRIGEGAGQGFRTLFEALASFNGLVRLHSGNGALWLKGTLQTTNSCAATVPANLGLQVTVECDLKK